MDTDSNFSILKRYGENFTSKEYVTNPAIGREQEIKELILVLLTPEKSAILIGKPGIGKTAIVEGLAYRIQKNDVPEALQGYTIINIKTASLLGTMPDGESKVQLLIDELKEEDKVLLFIDEIHMLIGSTKESALDFANIFKEGLGRGKIRVVGATTTEEYERYILRDKAFTRRFQRIEVPEPNREETIKIMAGSLPKIEKETGVRMKYSPYRQELIFGFLVDMTSEYKRVYEIGSRYPDCSLTLLKSAFSFAVFDNRKQVTILDVEKAIVNTPLVYPDVIKKELPKFKEMFKEMYQEESGETSKDPLELEEPKEELIPDDFQDEFDFPDRKEESLDLETSITAMGTRDTRVAPERIKLDTEEALSNPIQEELEEEVEPEIETVDLNTEYQAKQMLRPSDFENQDFRRIDDYQTSISSMGTRDTRVAPERIKLDTEEELKQPILDIDLDAEEKIEDDFFE